MGIMRNGKMVWPTIHKKLNPTLCSYEDLKQYGVHGLMFWIPKDCKLNGL
jgi:hypothetical protein